MQQENSQPIVSIPHHTVVKFSENKQPQIYFSSDFDSGNMSKVNRNSYDHYSIWTAVDAEGTPNEGYPKSWFHFQVGGFINRKITFSIHRVHFLWAVSKRTNLYRPVYKINNQNQPSQWQRLPHSIISLNLNDDQQLVLKFDFYFTKDIKSVRFAFLYPYSYEDQRNQVLRLKSLYQDNKDQDVFFKQYQLIKSYQKRILDLLVISSNQGKQGFQNIKYDQYFDMGQKLVKFRNNKPIIFVSARVHPIQTPSSFCMKGIIDFLLDKTDFRAFLLRKYFVFVLVPMLNPDGVSNGHCRMDHLNQNLNRYYKNPDPIKQSPCYAVRKLCEHYQKDNRMFMYLDLHAHPSNKGNFMFGNAIYDFIQQVQSQVYPKILSQNCINFEFQNCIFSRKHMKAKDRNQDMNKQGCGRVVFYKDFGIPHAYTLQCGYHMNSYNNNILPQNNTQNKYIVRYKLGKNGQKIYQNIQRLYSLQLLAKIEQTIRKPNNSKSNSKQQIPLDNDKIISTTKDQIKQDINSVDKDQNIQVVQQIKITTKSIESITTDDKSYLNRKQKYDVIKRYAKNQTANLNKSKNQVVVAKSNDRVKYSTGGPQYDGYDIFTYTSSPYDDIQSAYYKRQLPIYDVGSYENLGRNMLITILDIFNKNPYSRSIDLNEYRKQIAQKQSKLDRFRKQQAGIRNKMKNITQLIQEQFYMPWYKRNVFSWADNNGNVNQRTKRNKTLQFQITKSSQNKMRKNTKDVVKQMKQPQGTVQSTSQSTKRQLMLQSQVIKASIQIHNQTTTQNNKSNITSLNKIFHHQKSVQQYQNRNTLLAKKLKSFKSKQKNQIKQLSQKVCGRQQLTKKSIPLPTSQNNITLEEEIKVIKNQGLNLSTKIIKNPSFNMVNLRMRNFMMQGNSAISPHYNALIESNYHHAQIGSSQNKK